MTQHHFTGAMYMLGFIAWLFVAYHGFQQQDSWWAFAIICPIIAGLIDVFIEE